jgi:hypothetical protein
LGEKTDTEVWTQPGPMFLSKHFILLSFTDKFVFAKNCPDQIGRQPSGIFI